MKSQVSVSLLSVRILRVMLSGIFLVAGTNHLFNVDKTVQRIDQAKFKGIAYLFDDPQFLVIVSGVGMLIAGISLMIGFNAKWAAAVLALILIPITLTIQVGSVSTLGPLFKNIAIMGGLLFFILNDFENSNKTKP